MPVHGGVLAACGLLICHPDHCMNPRNKDKVCDLNPFLCRLCDLTTFLHYLLAIVALQNKKDKSKREDKELSETQSGEVYST
jgi:hypothetical protein